MLQWILTAGRFPIDPSVLDGAIVILESSEDLIPPHEFGWILRSLGERGVLEAAAAVLAARPPTSNTRIQRPPQKRRALRDAQRDVALAGIHRYNPSAVVVVGIPFGHTRPQWIVPYGGTVTVDATTRRVWADYA